MVTRDYWRKQFPPVCGRCRFERIWSLVPSAPNIQQVEYVCARMNISSMCARVLSYQLSKLYKYACVLCLITIKHFLTLGNAIVAEAVLEDKLADVWPDYPCLYNVRCPDLKNRQFCNKSTQEIAEKRGKTYKFSDQSTSFNLRLLNASAFVAITRAEEKSLHHLRSSSSNFVQKHRPCLIVIKI